MITHEKASIQVQAPKTWDKPTADSKIGDYIREPFQPIMVVADKDTLPDGKVWLLIKPETASCTQELIVEPELVIESSVPPTHLEDTPIEQPVLDYPSCKLQPAWLGQQEYEKGVWWGKQDASARRKPLYTKASCPHSTGYLDAYNRFTLLNQQFKQPPETKKPPMEWKVTYAPDWDWKWYVLQVEDKYIGKYSSCEEAEAAALKYIAAEQARREHRDLVMAAYAG